MIKLDTAFEQNFRDMEQKIKKLPPPSKNKRALNGDIGLGKHAIIGGYGIIAGENTLSSDNSNNDGRGRNQFFHKIQYNQQNMENSLQKIADSLKNLKEGPPV